MDKLRTDVLVIGGSAAGLVAAMTSKSKHPEKSVTMIRMEEQVMIPCGIPYIFGTLKATNGNVLPDAGLKNLGVDIVIDKVISINTDEKHVETAKGTKYYYEKLVVATGSTPFVPTWLVGSDLENVFTIPKNKQYLDIIMSKLSGFKNIATIGAGFIGVEVSDELKKADKNVSLIEIQSHILGEAFDKAAATEAEEILTSRGVNVFTGVGVKEILGNEKVESIKLSNGESMEVDAVILSVGYRPNVDLAKKAEIKINENGFIQVDEYMRTSVKDVFAVGDCAGKKDFATGKLTNIMLASTACAEARVAGMNLYKLSTLRSFKGTIGIYSTNIGDTSFGVAGLTERKAEQEGFEVVVGSFTGMDRHPGVLNNGHKQTVKLVVSKDSGLILGGEVVGGNSVGELINIIGFIIQSGMNVTELLVSQIGTQPMLTASPAAYPLIKAAEMVWKQLA